ncbi:DUF1178 family protein [Tropicibacter naphthalenivorans]|uniref:DUF1178 family protein n=1 Tax=Tropicibacter naphthalenivorans TaxID=441103 RepID=A0A0P1GNP8_9RHOB|nr:DUF1178 family protein [Tropicibacter naphthalenivorans]CUH75790.1 hypothetical protein TRN7648_00621 [Tropicibacter naphthalenivorans]SMC42232.1 hypothetical protein SAMN04488093_101263 [Tropicibacter naphthalenivorans]
MIQYSLKCAEGHQFDSWFQSASAFDKLQAAGHVACAICGSAKVDKALMAPRVNQADKPAPLSQEKSPAEQAIAAMKKHIETTSDYVGGNFATEARAMHLGEAPERPIWGEAKAEEAKALVEEGIPVAPLPFTPSRKSN